MGTTDFNLSFDIFSEDSLSKAAAARIHTSRIWCMTRFFEKDLSLFQNSRKHLPPNNCSSFALEKNVCAFESNLKQCWNLQLAKMQSQECSLYKKEIKIIYNVTFIISEKSIFNIKNICAVQIVLIISIICSVVERESRWMMDGRVAVFSKFIVLLHLSRWTLNEKLCCLLWSFKK